MLVFALVEACGGGGPGVPACRTGTPIADDVSPAATLTLTTGSYEGTGSPLCISDLGFQPAVVIIKGDTSEFAVWRSASMEGDSTADFASGKINFENGITSLDPGAFSLGDDPSVNDEGVTYHYVAFADSPEIKVGTYVGDGRARKTISGVGFEPALIWVKWDGVRSAVWRATTHPDDVASFFDGHDNEAGFVRNFTDDGFVVGGDPWVNHNGGTPDVDKTYHYVAFGAAPGLLQAGTYIGDGSDDRNVTGVGFQPDYVWVKRASEETKAVHRTSSLSGDSTLRFESVANGEDEIQALLPDGFQVGAAPAVNLDGDTYHYVAFKSGS